jgi:hypothetical protein
LTRERGGSSPMAITEFKINVINKTLNFILFVLKEGRGRRREGFKNMIIL